jgi:hypothetical protein
VLGFRWCLDAVGRYFGLLRLFILITSFLCPSSSSRTSCINLPVFFLAGFWLVVILRAPSSARIVVESFLVGQFELFGPNFGRVSPVFHGPVLWVSGVRISVRGRSDLEPYYRISSAIPRVSSLIRLNRPTGVAETWYLSYISSLPAAGCRLEPWSRGTTCPRATSPLSPSRHSPVR